MKEETNELNVDKAVKAIIRRALGYDSKEVVEEYAKDFHFAYTVLI